MWMHFVSSPRFTVQNQPQLKPPPNILGRFLQRTSYQDRSSLTMALNLLQLYLGNSVHLEESTTSIQQLKALDPMARLKDQYKHSREPLIRKIHTNEEIQEAIADFLAIYRSTPHVQSTTNQTLSEMLNSHRMKTKLDLLHP